MAPTEGWIQKQISLKPYSRGFHLVTHEIERQVPELSKITIGLAHIFIQHTSASLTLNENADPDVRVDMESHFSKLAPENAPYWSGSPGARTESRADLQ